MTRPASLPEPELPPEAEAALLRIVEALDKLPPDFLDNVKKVKELP